MAVQKSAAALYAATIDNKIAMKVGAADWSPIAGNVQVRHFSWQISIRVGARRAQELALEAAAHRVVSSCQQGQSR